MTRCQHHWRVQEPFSREELQGIPRSELQEQAPKNLDGDCANDGEQEPKESLSLSGDICKSKQLRDAE